MPRSFLIRKVYPKIDSEEEKAADDVISTEMLRRSSNEYQSSKLTPISSHEPISCDDKTPTTDVTSAIPNIGAMTEVDTTQKGSFQCELCCRSFNRASDLKRHQLAHTENKPYNCYLCDRQFTWLGNFQKHCASHVQPPPSRFSFFAGTPLDILRTSPSSIFYEGTPFTNSAMYFRNVPCPEFHCDFPRVPLQRSLTCNVCCLTFTTSRALKMHTRIHTGEKPYKCNQCSKAFARKDELHTHKYFHTGEKPYKCDKCTASFVRFGHLQRHKFVHYDVKPYQCKLCPKSFTQYRNLQTHMYKHTGERPFKCKYCPKGFTQYGTLQAHERTHTGERPFRCNFCNRRFITSSHLRWHVRTQH